MYRFEIYQNINIPPIYTDKINKSRYNLADYVLERTIDPVWNELSFVWEKDNGRAFFRKKLNGEFTLVDADYNWVLGITEDEFDINRYRYLKISEKIDGLWEGVWNGFFTAADGEFDRSRCVAVFSDLLVFDKYTPVIENIEAEVNLIDLDAFPSVTYSRNEYAYDSIIETSNLSVTDFCGDQYWEVGTYFKDTKYTLYSKKYRLTFGRGIWSGSDCSYTAQFVITKEWRRDYQWASSLPGGSWEDTGETDINGNNKYVRHYRGDESPSYATKRSKVEYETFPSYNEFAQNCSYCSLYNVDLTLEGDGSDELENDRGRSLSDAIIYAIKDYVRFFDNNGTLLPAYQSQFFSGAINPITGVDNKYRGILLFQLSDMKPTSNAATLAPYSIGTLEEFFDIFQCKWYIDDNGYFIVEHDKFFKNGLSYSVPPTVGLDISDQNIPIKISYLDDLPYKETTEFAYSVNPDFVGLPIECHGNIVNRREDVSSKEHSFTNFVTDLNQVVSNPTDIGNDGFFVLTADINNLLQTAAVHTSEGILTGITLSNGYMSISQIQENFWKYGRSLNYGIMNRDVQDFEQVRIEVQSDIVVNSCPQFDPMMLVRTSYGDGEVIKAEQTLADKKLTLELRY